MCGIVGYIGKSKNIEKILLDGLKRLEYRGYDSAGVAILDGERKHHKRLKREGNGSAIDDLREQISDDFSEESFGIAHTRWATHGEPTESNAHPHSDCSNKIFLVHNGIIENYSTIKDDLIRAGHKFESETDTEVLAHLVESKFSGNLAEAVRESLLEVRGTFGIAVVSPDDPDKIIVARQGSPLGIGIGDGEFFIASDAAPIVPHTKKIVYLDDGEIGVIDRENYQISQIKNNNLVEKEIQSIDWDFTEAEKSGYEHFMLKEISEQPESIKNSMRGRVDFKQGEVVLGGLKDHFDTLKKIKKLHIIACGTALYAGQVGEYMIEEFGGVSVETDYASEFRYRSPVLNSKDSALLAISQSGETADTLAAIREAKSQGVLTLGIVNSVGSTIARETDAGVYNHAGPEIGVASTKAFTSQLTIFALLAMFFGRQRNMDKATGQKLSQALEKLPKQVESIVSQSDKIKSIAGKYTDFSNFMFLGRKYNFPIAMEGALKLKEISYIHAEGYGAGEMKHGPLALIDQAFPTFCIVPNNGVREKMISNMQEVKARGGNIIAIVSEGDEEISKIVNDVIYIPETEEMLEPILTTIPLQLFAYHIATLLGKDVDKPRNLAKSVTVE